MEKNRARPRFKGKDRYHTFSQKIEPQRGCPLKGDKLAVPGVGTCRVRLSREIEGTVKQLRLTRRADGWFVLLVCDVPRPRRLRPTSDAVGIDVGLENFATLSTGEVIGNPRHLLKAERGLKTAQRKVSRRKKGSQRRKKAVRELQLRHLQVKRQRRDHHFKTAKPIVKEFDFIAVEDLKIKNLVRNPRLAKSICDAGWGNFLSILTVKASGSALIAGREIEKVAPAFTSQDCPRCRERVKKSLATREHRCLVCGYLTHRDHASSQTILLRARARRDEHSGIELAGQAQSAPSGSQAVVPAPASEPRTDAEEPVVRFLGPEGRQPVSSRA